MFTPGPWYFRDNIIGTHGLVLATIEHFSDNKEANAHLIAAAPDLYEALAELDACLDFSAPVYAGREDGWNFHDVTHINAAVAKAIAALAKARGETPSP